MIDKNKIKSAAQGYCDATYGTLNTNPFIAEAFRKGAKWAINEFLENLWHPAYEEPKKNRLVLTDTRSIMDKDYILVVWIFRNTHQSKWNCTTIVIYSFEEASFTSVMFNNFKSNSYSFSNFKFFHIYFFLNI